MFRGILKSLFIGILLCTLSSCAYADIVSEAKESCGSAYFGYEYLNSNMVKVRDTLWRYGAVDRACRIVIPVQYSNIISLGSDILLEYYGTYGLLDSYGYTIFPVEYDEIKKIGTDFYQISKGSYFAIVYKDGVVISNTYYTDVKQLSPTLLQIGSYDLNMNTVYGLMTKTGFVLVEPQFKKIVLTNPPYFVFQDVLSNKLLDVFGSELFEYENYKSLNFLFGTYFKVKNNDNNWGVVDKHGKALIAMMYDKIDLGNDGYIKVKLDGKWGAFNAMGERVLECEYGPFEINREIKNLPADLKHTAAYQTELQTYNVLLAYYHYYSGEYLYSAKVLSEIKERYVDNEILNLVQNLINLLYPLGYHVTK